ncbi:14.7 kDa ribonuclease H-like protein [Poriferisphaera corsica]|uniref:14.7 kDa ribonuclease H-like protein n=1 Tax=Poriferisphaera corsica TaxID=2528020 RepID=A0A517YVG0_9BACT|nr:ribonuclease HI family protein [Poriferisphaera corsica]QDU34204.1 14.7 kDa ribonuclease H-like protein [Poriferisphaera corsica]
MMKCIIHIDGGARGNPGPAAAGVTIKQAGTGKIVHEAGYYLGHMTNNSAEYNGLLHALEAAKGLKADELLIHSDSQLMVRQINGEYKVKSPDLKPLYTKALRLIGGFKKVDLVHVRREKNKRADELANLSMDAETDVFFTDEGGEESGRSSENSSVKSSGAGEGLFDNPTTESTTQAQGGDGFSVKLTTGDCQNGCGKGRTFVFGEKTPGGCCVHAAAAALGANPMKWDRNQTGEDMICNQCWQTIEVRKR